MLYNPTATSKLYDRIGWAEPVLPSTISVDPGNLMADSGRYYNSFHKLATVENVKSCIPNVKADGVALNKALAQMKKDAVLEVLSKVFDTNVRANYAYTQEFISINFASDYSDIILGNPALFDQAIGFGAAMKALELFLSTNRSNWDETKIGMNYSQTKGELEGFFTERGVLIGAGLTQKYEAAVITVIDVLFPIEEIDKAKVTHKNWW